MLENHQLQSAQDHFGKLLLQHLKSILESGLLLDEDYEVLLNLCNFKIYSSDSNGCPLRVIGAGFAFIGTVFGALKYNKPMLVLTTSLSAALFVFWEWKKILNRKQHYEIVNGLIKSFLQMRKLNTDIFRYLRMRKENENNLSLNTVNSNGEFVKILIGQSAKSFKFLYEEIEFLSNKETFSSSSQLSDDFASIKDMNVKNLLNFDDDTSDIKCVETVQNIFTFLVSKYLNYLGVNFSYLLNHFNNSTLIILLEQHLPATQKKFQHLHGVVQKEFNNFRYCASQKFEIKALNKNYFAKQLTGKLQQTLMGAVNNLAIIMEKSKVVLAKIQDAEEANEARNLQIALKDLRDHAGATYESLDVLCKLYGIISDAKSVQTDRKITIKEENKNLASIKFDDNPEILDEDFELFIPENEPQETLQATKSQEEDDQSGKYLSLMLKELQQSLKQHDRFVAARTKRGVVEETDDDARNINAEMKVNKFDLTVFQDEVKPPIPHPRLSLKSGSKLTLPPPPPPPPPPRPSINILEEETLNQPKTLNMFESIKVLSKQLHRTEEIFGNEGVNAESDSDE